MNAKATNRVISGSSAEGRAITEKLFGKKGEVVEFPQKRSFKEEIESMKKSGDIVDPNNLKKNDNVLKREMFNNSNLNKAALDRDRAIKAKARIEEKNEETIMDRINNANNRITEIKKEQAEMYRPKTDAEIKAKFDKQNKESVTDTITYIKSLKPMDAMKEANSVIGRKGKYKNLTPEESKKILQDTEDHIFERDIPIDPEDMANGGRIGFAGGRGIFSILKNFLKPAKPSGDDVKDFLSKRQFIKDLVGNTEKNRKTRQLDEIKAIIEETRKNPGFKFENVDIDKDIRPIFDKEIAESLKKNRKLNATGGRAGFYTGGITDVEPSLDDIGHGADALNARTRLLSPGSQATTSTGLNYLLADDNDNMRIPFSGGGMSKRAFLKLIASLGGTAAAFKTGILGLGEGGAKKAVTETVKQAAGSGGQVPPYFLNLVKKIKTMGDDVTQTQSLTERQTVKRYKDFELTEDKVTGRQEITRMKVDGSTDNKLAYDASEYYGKPLTEETYMSYTPGETIIGKGGKPVKIGPEYEEGRALLRNDRGNKGEIVEEIEGVSDDVIKEGTVFEDTLSEFGKADGGRIGFSAGSLAKLGITGSSRKFLERVFGKERFATMIENDPRMHRGMLEVVEMFRSKDKEGLKKYMQKFLPDMDDATVEDFIVGGKGSEGIEGQLIRLGSGREYENLIKMKKEADQIRKLDDFDIEDVSKNAEGGRIGFSGGGIFRAIITKAAAAKGMKPYEFIKVTSYKSLPPEVKMFLSAEDFTRLKSGQQDMYTNYIDMAKTRKNFQEQVEGGKTTPAKPLFENMEKMMDEQSYVPKNVTSDDIAQMELMVKNRFNKGRKDNAQGGLQTMLGE